MAKLKQQKYEVTPISAGAQAGQGWGGLGWAGLSPATPASPFCLSPQINVLYNRISHAQKL